MSHAKPEAKKVPYAKYAFLNPYNLTLLGAAATLSAATGSWLLGVAAAGAEALWMLFAPDSKLLRRVWFDKHHAVVQKEEARKRIAEKLAQLDPVEVSRYESLLSKREEVARLCEENSAFAAELLRDELTKLDQLVEAFVDISLIRQKYEEYLMKVDIGDIERQLWRIQSSMERVPEEDQERLRLAQKNLSVLMARREAVEEIQRYLALLDEQKCLIENTFQLFADRVMTMRTLEELSGPLDDAVRGVEAVREMVRDTRLRVALEQ